MEQKIVITNEDTDNVLCAAGLQKVDETAFGVQTEWCGYNIAIKRFLSLGDVMEFVRGVADGCFAQSDGSYMPEVKDFFLRYSLVGFYTNIILPEDVEEQNRILYGTDIIDVILQHIDGGQFRAIMDGIEKKVSYLVNTNMKRIEDEANLVVEQMTALCSELSETFKGIDAKTMSELIGAMSGMELDEKKYVQAVMEAREKQDGNAEGLKVVK